MFYWCIYCVGNGIHTETINIKLLSSSSQTTKKNGCFERFIEMNRNLRLNIEEAVEYLLKHFEEEFSNISKKDARSKSKQNRHSEPIFSDGGSSFGESSLNHVMIYMNLYII